MENKKEKSIELKQLILSELWEFCEKEFLADFENDYIKGQDYNKGLSDRTECFVEHLIKIINKKNSDKL